MPSPISKSSIPLSYLDTDTALTANSDVKVPSQKAVKAYVPVKATGAEINTGTNDDKFATPKAIADSNVAFVADIPVKATGAEVTTGTDDDKFVTAKALADAGIQAGGKFWSTVAGTPTRVSDTQFTITDTSNANKYDLLFKKGVVLKWLESSTVNIGMVISSSYASNTVTVNIVGDSLTAGFSEMTYCNELASVETFIIAGTLSAGTDLAKTWYTPQGVLLLSADAYVKTAGTTNSTVFDINDDGTTRFTTKPTITTGTTSDIDNVANTPTTEVAVGSLVTVDVDSVSTTPPVEAYIYLFYIPTSYLYRA